MFYHECEPFDWVNAPDMQNQNYNYLTLDKIKNAPRKWLSSLPIFEYAHVLTVITALRCGGDPDKYVEDLYKRRMNPILKQYYDKLAEYRYHRALLMRRCDKQLKKKLNGATLTDECAKMRVYAVKTRKALRGVCKDFEEELYGDRQSRKYTEDTLQETYPV